MHRCLARFRDVRWLLIAGVFLVAPGAAPLWADQPGEKAVFKGTWTAKYKDNQGKEGEGRYVFREDQNGGLVVAVSWEKETMELKGERLGLDAVRLEGKHEKKYTTYRYIGRMEGKTLVLRYLSIDEKTGKSASGESRLTRAK